MTTLEESQGTVTAAIREVRQHRGQRVVRGQITNAEYVASRNPTYAGNPCIEALPSWLELEDPGERAALLTRLTTSHPDSERLVQGRQQGAFTRVRLLNDIRRFFELLPQHLALEVLIQNALYEGLVGRNPLDRRFTDSVWSEVTASSQDQAVLPSPVTKGLGFFLGGGTGSGKTTAVERIAQLYPQVIRHSRYGNVRLILTQVVWLTVETPKDGSPITLIKNVFAELDDLLGTTYTEQYVEKARDRTYGGLKHRLRRVLANHCVGIIFLDEVQHFFEAREKKQSDAEVMNTLVELINTVNVPIVMIGTFKAHALFKHDARQGRRNVGCPPWEYLEYDECIETKYGLEPCPGVEEQGFLQFVQALWRIQYTVVQTPLTLELYDTFYEVTMGITDVACKLFLLAQARLIASGADTGQQTGARHSALITPQLLKDVYQEAFHLLHPALSVLRQYREEKAKAAAKRDTEALENARLFLLKLGDVILPEEYVEAKLKIARQSLTTVDNLRASVADNLGS